MNIAITNADKLGEAIGAAENKARVRTITPGDVADYCRLAEERIGIPRKYLDGVEISIDANARNFPHAYRGAPESTHFDAVNKRGKWYVTDIRRAGCRRAGHEIEIKLTDAAKAALIRRVENTAC